MNILTKAFLLSSVTLLAACSSNSKKDQSENIVKPITKHQCREAFSDMSNSSHTQYAGAFKDFYEIKASFENVKTSIDENGPMPLKKFIENGFDPDIMPTEVLDIRQALPYYTAGAQPDSEIAQSLIPPPILSCAFNQGRCNAFLIELTSQKSTEADSEGFGDSAARFGKFREVNLEQESSYTLIVMLNKEDQTIVNAITLSEKEPYCKKRIKKETATRKIWNGFKEAVVPW
jgi:hypothetical protein